MTTALLLTASTSPIPAVNATQESKGRVDKKPQRAVQSHYESKSRLSFPGRIQIPQPEEKHKEPK
jgi:hypothetical protein